MTKMLEKAFKEASRLPEEEQDALAKWLLEEFRAERQWEDVLSRSEDELGQLADEALAEHKEGRTPPLDPTSL